MTNDKISYSLLTLATDNIKITMSSILVAAKALNTVVISAKIQFLSTLLQQNLHFCQTPLLKSVSLRPYNAS